jgi:hypothetical protein
VTDLKSRDDAILHIGKYKTSDKKFSIGEEVNLKIDEEFRK